MIQTLVARFGRCPRIICFDRGMATEANLRQLRRTQRSYLCGSRRAVVRQQLPVIRSGPWTVVRGAAAEQPTIEVHELPSTTVRDEPAERWLLCRSAGCLLKEQQLYDARLATIPFNDGRSSLVCTLENRSKTTVHRTEHRASLNGIGANTRKMNRHHFPRGK